MYLILDKMHPIVYIIVNIRKNVKFGGIKNDRRAVRENINNPGLQHLKLLTQRPFFVLKYPGFVIVFAICIISRVYGIMKVRKH